LRAITFAITASGIVRPLCTRLIGFARQLLAVWLGAAICSQWVQSRSLQRIHNKRHWKRACDHYQPRQLDHGACITRNDPLRPCVGATHDGSRDTGLDRLTTPAPCDFVVQTQSPPARTVKKSITS
jgi:hypothetical protein